MGEPKDGVAYIRDGWFYETHSQDIPGHCSGLQIEEILFHEKSKFQESLIFRSKTFGRVWVLDGIVQMTEKDECSYQEMIVFLPLTCHKDPKQVLIVGGGDGGVARELVKHPDVQRVVVCELDEVVVAASKKYLPFTACGLDHPKVELIIGDAWEFVKNHKNEFDVIISEACDTVEHGKPAEIFKRENFVLMKEALREGGILIRQGTLFWHDCDREFLADIYRFCKSEFPSVGYATTSIPSYTGGVTGFLLCSLDPTCDVSVPKRKFSREELDTMGLRYYNSQLHTAAFALPTFVSKMFDEPEKPVLDQMEQ